MLPENENNNLTSALSLTKPPLSSRRLPEHRIGCIQHSWERDLQRRLQPILAIVQRMGRRIDHMKRIREPRMWTLVAFRLVQDRAVDKHKITFV